jgi:hypothetical protein
MQYATHEPCVLLALDVAGYSKTVRAVSHQRISDVFQDVEAGVRALVRSEDGKAAEGGAAEGGQESFQAGRTPHPLFP